MTFKKDRYKILRNIIPIDVANFVCDYFRLKRRVAKTLFDTTYIPKNNSDWGCWRDSQAPKAYSCYSDMAMETILFILKEKMEKETDLKLHETYSYARLYGKGDILEKHTDRFSCEVSTTLNLGGDMWPIYLKDTKGKEIEVKLKPTDMLIYSGCELEHWRNQFEGDECIQVFLHYNDISGKNAEENKYDTRPHLGLPTWFKGKKIQYEK
jgi:hypothetical protein